MPWMRKLARVLALRKVFSSPSSPSSSQAGKEHHGFQSHTSLAFLPTPITQTIPISPQTLAFDSQMTPEILSAFLIWYFSHDLLRPTNVFHSYTEFRDRCKWIRMGRELQYRSPSLPMLQSVCHLLGLDYETLRLRMVRFAQVHDMSSSEMAGYHMLGGYDADHLMLQYDLNVLQKCRPRLGSIWDSYRSHLILAINNHLHVVTSLLPSNSPSPTAHCSPESYGNWMQVLQLQTPSPYFVCRESWVIAREVKGFRQPDHISGGSNDLASISADFHRAMMRRMVETSFSGVTTPSHAYCARSTSGSSCSSATLYSPLSPYTTSENSWPTSPYAPSHSTQNCAACFHCVDCTYKQSAYPSHSRSSTPVEFYRRQPLAPEPHVSASPCRSARRMLQWDTNVGVIKDGPFELEASL